MRNADSMLLEPEFRSRLHSRVAQGTPTALPSGRRLWGRLLWLTFLGEARKVSCRRATPGFAACHQSLLDQEAIDVLSVFNSV